MRILGFILLIAASIGAYFCVVNVLWQDDVVRRFVPVKAHLLSTDIRMHRGSKGSTSYSPEARYAYEYGGVRYESTRVLPISWNSSRSWAAGVLARIELMPEGAGWATAYVNARNPQEAVLVRAYNVLPYALGMAALVAAAVGLGMLVGVISAGRTEMKAIALDDSGWQLLLPQRQLRRLVSNAVAWLIGGTLAVVVMPAHWLLVAGQGGVTGLVLGTIAAGIIAGLGIVAYRRWSVSRHVSDARLRIRPAPMRRGESLAMEVGMDAYAPLQVLAMKAKVLCIEHYKERRGQKTVYGTRTREEKAVELNGPGSVKAGEEIAGQGEVTFDTAAPPDDGFDHQRLPVLLMGDTLGSRVGRRGGLCGGVSAGG